MHKNTSHQPYHSDFLISVKVAFKPQIGHLGDMLYHPLPWHWPILWESISRQVWETLLYHLLVYGVSQKSPEKMKPRTSKF